STSGGSGSERPVREFIASRLRIEKKCRTDNIGNLIVEVGEGSPHIALVAHMDEVGLLVTKLEDDGSLRFRKVGGVDDRILQSRKVQIHTSKGSVAGIIGIKPSHLMTDPEEMKKTVPAEKLRIDVGTRSKKETERLGIRVLDSVTLEKGLIRLGRDLIVGRGLDDRVGCAILIRVFEQLKKKKTKGRFTCVWSVQEEMGLRGAKVIAHTLKPDYVIVLDTCSSGDAPGIDEGHLQPAVLGKGPAIRYFDSLSIASPLLRKMATDIARIRKIPIQEIAAGGTTDATAVQESGTAVIPIGVGMRNTHSTTETVSLTDIDHAIKLVMELIEELCRRR
ncbi:MAG: M42 family metallopeptidase, partial [Thermoplasmata archaeon]|nr:M42 family metallopeptidase [Thermoplasmata archaeon]